MTFKDAISSLSETERIDLAVKLTAATMSAMDYEVEGHISRQKLTQNVADRTYMVFGRMYDLLSKNQEPTKFADSE